MQSNKFNEICHLNYVETTKFILIILLNNTKMLRSYLGSRPRELQKKNKMKFYDFDVILEIELAKEPNLRRAKSCRRLIESLHLNGPECA